MYSRRIVFLALAAALVARAGTAAAQEPVVPLDTVTVTAASRASQRMGAAARAVEVIGAEAIRRAPAARVTDALQWAFGVDVMPRSPALADVALRGSSFEQVLVLVDGVRVSDAQTGHFDLDLAVPLDQVERIEVLRGPASALHGADAVGGVINVVTRRAGPSQRAPGGAAPSAPSASGWRTRWRSAPRGRTWAATCAAPTATGRAPTTNRHRAGRAQRAARRAHPARGRGATRRATSARTASTAPTRRTRGPAPPPPPSPGGRRPRAALAVEPLLSFRGHGDDFILDRARPGYYRNQHTTRQLGGELDARWAAAPRLRLAAGAEAYRDQLRSASLGDREEDRAALFAEAAAGRVGRATATAGLRGDWHQGLDGFVSPSLAAAWWPRPGLRLRASLGRALRTPTWTERYYHDPANVGDPQLAPERSWSAEAGLDAYPRDGLQLGLTGFVRRARDLIDWARPTDSPAEPWHTRNVNQARFRGLEAQLSLDDLLGVRWSARGSWLDLHSTAEPGFTSKYALRPLARQLTLSAARELGPLQLDVSAEHARRVGDDAFVRLDARAAWRLGAARLYLDLQNATDARYPDIVGLPAPGRALFAGVEVGSSG